MSPPKRDSEYEPDDDGPEAKAYRDLSDEQKRRHEADMDIIDRLLDSLTPADAHRHVFTWAEQKKWFLWRKKGK